MLCVLCDCLPATVSTIQFKRESVRFPVNETTVLPGSMTKQLSRWMADLPPEVTSRPLWSLKIPGEWNRYVRVISPYLMRRHGLWKLYCGGLLFDSQVPTPKGVLRQLIGL